MSATTEEGKSDRLTLRLPGSELDRLRELARQRQVDLAALAREAISAYLDGVDPHAREERLAQDLKGAMREESTRVIERQAEITRSLIAALNAHLAGKS